MFCNWSLSPVGMVTKPSSEQSQDFSIHNEDFPALPGPNYQTKDPTSTNEDSKTVTSLSLRHPLSASLTSQLILICPVCLHAIRIWTHRESQPLTQMVQSSPAIRAPHRATTTSRRKGFRCFLTVRQIEQIIAQEPDISWSLFLDVNPENVQSHLFENLKRKEINGT